MASKREHVDEEGCRPPNILRRRARPLQPVRQAPFAGRIGGNQEFVAIAGDEETEALLSRQPDAV